MRYILVIVGLSVCFLSKAQWNTNTFAFDFSTLREALSRHHEEGAKIKVYGQGNFTAVVRSKGFVPNGVNILADDDSVMALVRDESQTNGLHSKWVHAGDSTLATDAIRNLFNVACQKGNINVYIDSGVYVIDKFLQFNLPPGKNITVYAYGAKFIAAKLVGYNLFEFNGQDTSAAFNWFGGTFDGNKDYQNSPVSSIDTSLKLAPNERKDTIPSVGNRGLLTVLKFARQKVQDVTVQNSKGEGVILRDGYMGDFENCYGKGGFPISYNNAQNIFNTQYQASYFKVRSELGMAASFNHIRTEGGSIGCHYSSNNAGSKSHVSFDDVVISNPMQDAIHVEHCTDVSLLKIFASGDTVNGQWLYRPKITIGGQTQRALLQKIFVKNGKIDFQNAQKAARNDLQDFHILYQAPPPANDDSTGNNTVIYNCYSVQHGKLMGWLPTCIYGANNVFDVKFEGFDTSATTGVAFAGGVGSVENCSFENLLSLGEMINIGDTLARPRFVNNRKIYNIGIGINLRVGESGEISGNYFQKVKRYAIFGSNRLKTLDVHDNTFANVGLQALGTPDFAIIGSSINTGASNPTIVFQNNTLIKDSAAATNWVLYSNDANNQNIVYKGNIEIGDDFKVRLSGVAAKGKIIVDETGNGIPEGNIRADIGSVYHQNDVSGGGSVWVKDTGINNRNGWFQLMSTKMFTDSALARGNNNATLWTDNGSYLVPSTTGRGVLSTGTISGAALRSTNNDVKFGGTQGFNFSSPSNNNVRMAMFKADGVIAMMNQNMDSVFAGINFTNGASGYVGFSQNGSLKFRMLNASGLVQYLDGNETNAGYVLTNTGSGIAKWQPASSFTQYWTDNGTTLNPVNLGRNVATNGTLSGGALRATNNDVQFGGTQGFRFTSPTSSTVRMAMFKADGSIDMMNQNMDSTFAGIKFVNGLSGYVGFTQNGVMKFRLLNSSGYIQYLDGNESNSGYVLTNTGNGTAKWQPAPTSSGSGIPSGTGYIKQNGSTTSFVTAIPNSDLANNSININGTNVPLGGSISVGASTSKKSVTITASSYSVASDISVVFVNYTGGQALISLPLPSSFLDREITIRNLNFSQQVNVANIETSTGLTGYILPGEGSTFHSDGSVWQTISVVKF